MSDITNCPNCGAVVHDCVCEYCGTVFPTPLGSFCGKPCVLVTIDDGNLFAMALDVQAMERNPQTDYFTDPDLLCINHSKEVTVTGTLGDTQALFRIAHDIKKRMESTWGEPVMMTVPNTYLGISTGKLPYIAFELEQKNTALTAMNVHLQKELEDEHALAEALGHELEQIKAENDKLRELAMNIWRACPVSEDYCKCCQHHIDDDDWCDFVQSMRELRIEVDE